MRSKFVAVVIVAMLVMPSIGAGSASGVAYSSSVMSTL